MCRLPSGQDDGLHVVDLHKIIEREQPDQLFLAHRAVVTDHRPQVRRVAFDRVLAGNDARVLGCVGNGSAQGAW